jgi:hypothetical protein
MLWSAGGFGVRHRGLRINKLQFFFKFIFILQLFVIKNPDLGPDPEKNAWIGRRKQEIWIWNSDYPV